MTVAHHRATTPRAARTPSTAASFNADFFVRQHYLDFLNREPDAAGLAFWTGQINSCGADAACAEVQAHQRLGGLLPLHRVPGDGLPRLPSTRRAFGNTRVGGAAPLTLREFLPDTQQIGRGVVVSAPGWQQLLEANKPASSSTTSSRARSSPPHYPSTLRPPQFVDALNANAGGALSQTERDALVNDLTTGREDARASPAGRGRGRRLRRRARRTAPSS